MKDELNNLSLQLKAKVISTYKKMGDKVALVQKIKGKNSWTGNELAKELEDETEFGIRMMSGMLLLTIDLLSRDKINMEEDN